MRTIFIACILFLFLSCREEKFDRQNLYGNWITEKSDCSVKLNFQKNNSYAYSTACGDVMSKHTGLYFINHNSKRGSYTLTLVPDIAVSDSIFLKCINYDIIRFTDSIIVIKDPSRWVNTTVGIVKDEYYWSFKRLQ